MTYFYDQCQNVTLTFLFASVLSNFRAFKFECCSDEKKLKKATVLYVREIAFLAF
jgi:hypothetical protein